MKTAFAVWNNRIAPVFDVARRVIMMASGSAARGSQVSVVLVGDQPLHKVQQLSDLGANSLVCGAISRSLQAALTARGIGVMPFIAGDVQDVIMAWQGQNFDINAFAMPGRRRGNHRFLNRYQQEEVDMQNLQGGGGRRSGGRGQGGKGRCRQDRQQSNPSATANTGACICTQCGHTEAHAPGNPCVQKKCPQCGAVLSRQ